MNYEELILELCRIEPSSIHLLRNRIRQRRSTFIPELFNAALNDLVKSDQLIINNYEYAIPNIHSTHSGLS